MHDVLVWGEYVWQTMHDENSSNYKLKYFSKEVSFFILKVSEIRTFFIFLLFHDNAQWGCEGWGKVVNAVHHTPLLFLLLGYVCFMDIVGS